MASDSHDIQATTEQPSKGGHEGAHEKGPLDVDTSMVIWTWVTFAIVAFVLHKVAWKPILAALDSREGRIQKALDDAERASEELHKIEETCEALKSEAASESKQIIAKARDAAAEAASHVEAKTTEKVAIMYENATRDIEAMKNQVVADMKKDQADIIITLTSQLVAANIDTAGNQELTDRLLKDL
jgi:F-type H+-transporting ATPase subunit b